jgi:hypothetical protein
MHMVVDVRKELGQQSLRLRSHEAELNRIDTALVTAAKMGTQLPSPNNIFGALTDASIMCADVLDKYGAKPIPANVGTELVRLHCAMTDLAASLKMYAVLSVSKDIQVATTSVPIQWPAASIGKS